MAKVFEERARSHRAKMDVVTSAAIYEGVTVTQLTTLWRMDARDVRAKIEGRVRPVGERNGSPIYRIRDVAPYLSPPVYDIDEFIARMSKADLPPALTESFWKARKAQQSFEERAAELWPTDAVRDLIASLFSSMRMAILLTREGVERETELTPRQREIMTETIDTALESAHATITSTLEERRNAAKAALSDSESDPDDS